MDDIKARQQIIDKIKDSSNILVTVSNDPSVDALSAALGLSLLIDKLEKYATAVFSGSIPPAINFLEPEKTFESTTDSLRDFIIALDKEKADHLRVKPEGDVVKIYVTPYRTTITPDDLTFDQGDYNVELVIALGVDNQDHLDGALDAHGKILHDATVITMTAGEQTSNLGSIDWHDDQASSLSEMVANLADSLKKDKKSLLDKQSATALLTGIVAETDRFSNPRTTSRSMTVAATLMSAGADQQLIASKLQEGDELDEPETSEEEPAKEEEPAEKPAAKKDGDVLTISHEPHSEPGETLEEMDKRVKAEEQHEAEVEAKKQLEEEQADEKPTQEKPVEEKPAEAPVAPVSSMVSDVHGNTISSVEEQEPLMGGTLNATTDEAEEDNRQELASDQNKTILSHAYLGGGGPAMSGAMASEDDSNFVDPLTQPATGGEVHSAYAFDQPATPSVAPAVEPPANASVPPAAPVTPAPAPAPVTPPSPTDLGLPMPPPLPDFSTPTPPQVAPAYAFDQPTTPSPIAPPPTSTPEILGDILAPEPPAAAPTVPPVVPTPPAPQPNDPSQFKIPGQQ